MNVLLEIQGLPVCQVVIKALGSTTTGEIALQSLPPSVIVHPSLAIIFALAPAPRQYVLSHP
jgi:hypothetical protein